MPKAHDGWRVLPHGPIEKLESNLWTVTGTLEGMDLKRVMSLVRLDDGRVFVHSAIALEEEAMAEIEAWGRPAVLLVPNRFHRLDAPAWVERYPDLQVLCPRGARKSVAQVVRVDGELSTLGESSTLRLEHLEGVNEGEAIAVVKSDAGATLVFTDAVFNMPHSGGLVGFLLRHVAQSTGGPRVTRLFRWLAVKDRKALRAHLERLADTPGLLRIVVSHHERIDEHPAEVLRQVAAHL